MKQNDISKDQGRFCGVNTRVLLDKAAQRLPRFMSKAEATVSVKEAGRLLDGPNPPHQDADFVIVGRGQWVIVGQQDFFALIFYSRGFRPTAGAFFKYGPIGPNFLPLEPVPVGDIQLLIFVINR
ncbi:hypothetical protein [Pseudoflavonifractor phocaeensis]|uniref:hypothetical protein n=1 Tax=Pseudoflavonifractor phocaeensis TaxID=1870988 RepID=UPI0019561563|nr:hypothetical protein [Pseudoflavonifractor phocaeensis]